MSEIESDLAETISQLVHVFDEEISLALDFQDNPSVNADMVREALARYLDVGDDLLEKLEDFPVEFLPDLNLYHEFEEEMDLLNGFNDLDAKFNLLKILNPNIADESLRESLKEDHLVISESYKQEVVKLNNIVNLKNCSEAEYLQRLIIHSRLLFLLLMFRHRSALEAQNVFKIWFTKKILEYLVRAGQKDSILKYLNTEQEEMIEGIEAIMEMYASLHSIPDLEIEGIRKEARDALGSEVMPVFDEVIEEIDPQIVEKLKRIIEQKQISKIITLILADESADFITISDCIPVMNCGIK